MNSSECYKCHKSGHFARECPSSEGRGGGYRGGRGGGGYRGGRGGDSRSSPRASCYNCGRSGHFARECRELDKTCYTCGKAGHISRECENEGKVTCYQCGKAGHVSRDCPMLDRDREERKCYSCGDTGHISRDCPEGGNSAEVDDTVCYRASSVNIYEPSTAKSQEKGTNHRNPTMYILIVKDSSTRKPAFKWKELGEIIDRFEDATKENPIYGYKVGKCPRGFTYTKMWSLLIYASVPTFGFFFLMIWAWKQKIFKHACMLPDEEQKYPDPLSNARTAQQNQYEFTKPKVVLENNRGRRRTLDFRNSLQNDEDERDNNEEHVLERTSSFTDPDSTNLKEIINNRHNRRRPSIQSLLCGNNSDQQSYKEKIQENDEHFYDSVACDAEVTETRL